MAQSLQDGPRLKERLDAERSEFTSEAGMLKSAERRLLIVQHAVDRYAAGSDLRCDAARALKVRTAYVSVEAVLSIVRYPDRILFVLVGDDREDGPENLFPGDCHIILHIDKYRGFDEITRLEAGRMSFASDKHLCTFFNTLANVGLHTLILLLVHHWSDGGFWVGRIADWKCARGGQDRPCDFLEATRRHEEPGPSDASLTAVQEPDDERIRDGLLEIGIIKQNVGRLAAQLERDALHRRSTFAHDRSSDSGRARK